ncbi:hypothetical protein AVEN_54625-1 [Araneus ventricosus]|uniref:Uncharacterized protein n=1 Tax=Araneus ventricosus TaxID=182803 RepID=A0A4Y2BNY7_ARAVE|nr:hypothetical protein AVEN_54625-1 [Araneus ventricosus]
MSSRKRKKHVVLPSLGKGHNHLGKTDPLPEGAFRSMGARCPVGVLIAASVCNIKPLAILFQEKDTGPLSISVYKGATTRQSGNLARPPPSKTINNSRNVQRATEDLSSNSFLFTQQIVPI